MIKADLDKFDLPDEPGVYFFVGAKHQILYVGKATSLKARVRSYFDPDLGLTRGERIVGMVAGATAVQWEKTDSVLEALIYEANLIKKHQPPYNVLEKDNKSFNYLVITKEQFPRVLVVRGRELFQKWNDKDIKHLFGPFPNGGALRDAMKLVRKIFPFRDRCEPMSSTNKRPCFNRQLGLCPGVCIGEVTVPEYARTIHQIVLLFSGRKKTLLRELERDMKRAASTQAFEAAAVARRQIAALTHIHDIALISEERRVSTGGGSVRIECYDIAHTSGTETVGVMVAVIDGESAKHEYRKFKLDDVGNNDTKALTQVLTRRLAHTEWQYPRVIVVDGGTGQVHAIKNVLAAAGLEIPVVGVVKDERHKPMKLIGDATAIRKYEREALLADSEAHRFAISWHIKRRQRAFLQR